MAEAKDGYITVEQEHYDSLHSSIARITSSEGHLRRTTATLRSQRNRLENAIRNHMTGKCDCADRQECLLKLYRLVPVKPRPTPRQQAQAVAVKIRSFNG